MLQYTFLIHGSPRRTPIYCVVLSNIYFTSTQFVVRRTQRDYPIWPLLQTCRCI